MTFQIKFRTTSEEFNSDIDEGLDLGDVLFLLGPNGSGKSSLLHEIAGANNDSATWIKALRTTVIDESIPSMTASLRVTTEGDIRNRYRGQDERVRERLPERSVQSVVYDVVSQLNVENRAIAGAVRDQDSDLVARLGLQPQIHEAINDVFESGNMTIRFEIDDQSRIWAKRHNVEEKYSISELSDGERSAFLLAGAVLTAKTGTLLLIDEPERHLHRAISAPLLRELFKRRDDCSFVVSTHDPALPQVGENARLWLVRGCDFSGKKASSWAIDMVGAETELDDELLRSLWGAREKVLFVEGTNTSADISVYRALFPSASIIPKGSRRDVFRTTEGVRATGAQHWVDAFGLVDGDGASAATQSGAHRQVATLPYYSVEAVYCHPNTVRHVAGLQDRLLGEQTGATHKAALQALLKRMKTHKALLLREAGKKDFMLQFYSQLPDDDSLFEFGGCNILVDTNTIKNELSKKFDNAAAAEDWSTLLRLCPTKRYGLIGEIANALRFKDRATYEDAVHVALRIDNGLANAIRTEILQDFPEEIRYELSQ